VTTALRVHLVDSPESPHEDALARPELAVSYGDTVPPDTQVLVQGYPTREQLLAAPLEAMVFPYAGLPPATRTLLLEVAPDLPVYNQHHHADAVAESAVGLLFAVAKGVVPMDRALRRGDWRPAYAPDPAVRLGGRSAVVLGYGAIGSRVAALLRALGLQVSATRRTAERPYDDRGVRVHPARDTAALLARAEVLVICLPGTEATHGLLDAAALARLPQGALLVNVARAGITPEEALFAALRDGRLGGAALDVWWTYPKAETRAETPPSRLPFHELDQVVMSPHRTGHGPWVEEARYAALVETLLALARGTQPPHRVDVRAGY